MYKIIDKLIIYCKLKISITIILKGPIAELLIQNAQRTGGWVCLQNCHLSTSWMGQLEAICDSFDISTVNSKFRLWLTSYPSEKVFWNHIINFIVHLLCNVS